MSSVREKYYPQAEVLACAMPRWLIQIPSKKLSHGAKILYSRMRQWALGDGTCRRTDSQLAREIGVSNSSVEKYKRELYKFGLVANIQPIKHRPSIYEFYTHEAMNDDIVEELLYGEERPSQSDQDDENRYRRSKGTVPPISGYGTADLKVLKGDKGDKGECNPYSPLPEPQQTNPNSTNPKAKPKTPCSSDDERVKVAFDRFWDAYPRKEGKKPAFKAWKKGKCTDSVEQIVERIEFMKKYNHQWEYAKYVPMPATWLNQERWEDEIPTGHQNIEYQKQYDPELHELLYGDLEMLKKKLNAQ